MARIPVIFFLIVASLSILLGSLPGVAAPLKTIQVADGVYAFVGELGQRSPSNLGNNATFGAVITPAGVVLIDPGGSSAGAASIEAAVRQVTDKPVVMVINTGGQDHRWLGNGHFRAKGASIVASKAAVADQKARADAQFQMLRALIGETALAGTKTAEADRVFDTALDLDIGGVPLQVRHVAAAHTPGDSFVWLPRHRVVFTGDIVYVERMLGVNEHSSSKGWLDAFAAIEALKPAHVVPGHGAPTSLARARADTGDYLVHLRKAARAVLDRGGDAQAAGGIDQAAFMRLEGADQLARRNALQVFVEMEFE